MGSLSSASAVLPGFTWLHPKTQLVFCLLIFFKGYSNLVFKYSFLTLPAKKRRVSPLIDGLEYGEDRGRTSSSGALAAVFFSHWIRCHLGSTPESTLWPVRWYSLIGLDQLNPFLGLRVSSTPPILNSLDWGRS